MSPRKRTLFGCLAAIAVPYAAILAWGLAMSDATEYCPWQHHLHDLSSCEVLDEAGGRALVQHADHDRNLYYLEIVGPSGERTRFELPSGIRQLAPQGYQAALIAGSGDHVLLNGRRVKLVPIR